MYNNQALADAIKMLSKERSIPLKKMLEETGINRNFIYDLEKKGKAPSIASIIQIASYYDVSTDYLLGRTDSPTVTTPSDANISPAEKEQQGTEEQGDVIKKFDGAKTVMDERFLKVLAWTAVKQPVSKIEVEFEVSYENDEMNALVKMGNIGINSEGNYFVTDAGENTLFEAYRNTHNKEYLLALIGMEYELSKEESNLVELFRLLSGIDQHIIIGKIYEFLKTENEETNSLSHKIAPLLEELEVLISKLASSQDLAPQLLAGTDDK